MPDGNWHHATCGECLAHNLDAGPILLRPGDLEICCWCGRDTADGFYVERDPVETPCQGGVGPASLLPQAIP